MSTHTRPSGPGCLYAPSGVRACGLCLRVGFADARPPGCARRARAILARGPRANTLSGGCGSILPVTRALDTDRHLLGLDGMTRERIESILDQAEGLAAVASGEAPPMR